MVIPVADLISRPAPLLDQHQSPSSSTSSLGLYLSDPSVELAGDKSTRLVYRQQRVQRLCAGVWNQELHPVATISTISAPLRLSDSEVSHLIRGYLRPQICCPVAVLIPCLSCLS